MRKFFLALSIGGVFFVACSKEPTQSESGVSGGTVRFRTHILQTKATEMSFEEGDAVSIFASDEYGGVLESLNYADNSEYVYKSGEFCPDSSEDGISYPDEYTSLHFYAVWPYSSSYSGNELNFSVSQDQTSQDEYAASNLMLARTDAIHSETVDLNFDHLMCKVVINIHSDNFPTGDRICAFNNVYTDVIVNMNDASVTTTGSQGFVYGSLNGTNSFKAILPPQTIPAGTQFFLFQIGENSWQWKPTKAIILTSGVEYVYDLSI